MDLGALSRGSLAVTFLWLLGWALWATRRLLQRDQNSLLFALVLLFVLYGAPAGIDYVLGVPGYLKFPGYYSAAHDPVTVTIASAYICLVPVLWRFFCRTRIRPLAVGPQGRARLKRRDRVLLHLTVIAPLLLLPLVPDPFVFRTYGAAALGLLTPRQQEFHYVLVFLSTFSILAAAGLVSHQRRLLSPQTFYLLAPSAAAIWLHGKRSIVAVAAFVVGYQLWRRGWLNSRRLLPAVLITSLLLAGYTQVYQRFVREVDLRHASTAQSIERARLDFCRDHVLRLVVHGELRPQRRLLEHRGQSFLFMATMLVPRKWWPEKPLPYARYVVSAAYGVPPQYWGWGHPSSILDESIANLGWLGALLGPLFVAGIATLGNRARTLRTRALSALVVVYFLHVQLTAFAPVALAWACVLILDSRKGLLRQRRPRQTTRLPARVGPNPT